MRRLPSLAVPVAAALAISFALAVPAHASGTSYTWIGSSAGSGGDNHSWTDPKNWSPGGVPGTGDSVAIDSPDATHCTAHVDTVPTVSLAGLTIQQNPDRCGVSLIGSETTTVTVTGSFSWDGGDISAAVMLDPGSAGTISGTNGRLDVLDADLTVGGSLTLSGLTGAGGPSTGALQMNTADILHVAAGGTLTSSGANNVTHLSCCLSPAKIVNDGTLVVDGGDLAVGAVEVDQNGTLAAADGGRLVTEKAPLTAGDGASYTGSGGWLIENGALARLSGTQTVGADFHLELGGLDVAADAHLGGTASFAGTGTIDWTGGTVEGNFIIGHGVHLVASGAHINNGRRVLSGADGESANAPSTLTNHGTMTFDDDAAVLTSNRAKLVNAGDGTITIAPGVVFSSASCCVNPDQLVNGGTVAVPTGTTTVPAELHNVAYKSTGTTSVAAGRQLLLSGDASGLLSGAALTGAGALAVTAPLTVSGSNSVGAGATLDLQVHGSLNGTSTFTGAGALGWRGGTFSGAVTVAVGAGTTVSGPDPKAVANVDGGGAPSTLTFTSHLTVVAGTSAHHDGIDLGSSTLTLKAASTVGSFVDLYGGKLVNAAALTIRPGAVERGGSSSTVNKGTLSLAAGATLHALGAYSQPAGGTLSVHLAAGSRGRLSVQGSVSLKGTLAAHDDGSYSPGAGAKVRIVSASSLTSAPSCTTTSGAGSSARHWVTSTSAAGLWLTRRAGAHRSC